VHIRISGEHKQVPGETVGGVIGTVRRPAHNLSVTVAVPGIWSVCRGVVATGIGLLAAILVVGETAIDLVSAWIGGNPFRAVHGCRPDLGSGHAGVNTDLGLRRHAGGFRRQFDPFAGHVVGEFGDIEFSGFQKIGIVTACCVFAVAYEAIEELAAFIVAHIDNDTAIAGNHQFRVFMFEAAKRRALFRRGGRIKWIDLHNIARAVRLVGML